MNIASLYAEIEADQEWRQKEVRFFQNQLSNISGEEQQDQFRRALILMLYAHFEGFCKFAFSLFVNAINSEAILCKDATFALVAASLGDIFSELRNPERKNLEFRRDLPDDTKLHRFARDREFIERFSEFVSRPVKIPDHVVDMESNLKPIVLRKNLFRLGFPFDQLDAVQGNIDKLLNYRNRIAHGEAQAGIKAAEYDDLRAAAYKIMDEVKRAVMTSLKEKSYLRTL